MIFSLTNVRVLHISAAKRHSNANRSRKMVRSNAITVDQESIGHRIVHTHIKLTIKYFVKNTINKMLKTVNQINCYDNK